jgi:hypothetical protein
MNPTIARLVDAMNRHDPGGMAATMAPDYRSEQPAHPNRAFTGNAQVVENWTAMFAAVPDIVADVLREDTVGTTSWSECWWHGHRPDGTAYELRGVIVAELREDGLIQAQRLYVELVEGDGPAIAETVRDLVEAATSPPPA